MREHHYLSISDLSVPTKNWCPSPLNAIDVTAPCTFLAGFTSPYFSPLPFTKATAPPPDPTSKSPVFRICKCNKITV